VPQAPDVISGARYHDFDDLCVLTDAISGGPREVWPDVPCHLHPAYVQCRIRFCPDRLYQPYILFLQSPLRLLTDDNTKKKYAQWWKGLSSVKENSI
jgi:hypothetical protein